MDPRIILILIFGIFIESSLFSQSNYSVSLYGGSFTEGVSNYDENKIDVNNINGVTLGAGIFHEPSDRFEIYGTAEYLINQMNIKIKDCQCNFRFGTGEPVSFNLGIGYKPINQQKYSWSTGIGFSYIVNYSSRGSFLTHSLPESAPESFEYEVIYYYALRSYGSINVYSNFDYDISNSLTAFAGLRLTTELFNSPGTSVGIDYRSDDSGVEFNESFRLNLNNTFFTLGIKYNIFGGNFPKRK